MDTKVREKLVKYLKEYVSNPTENFGSNASIENFPNHDNDIQAKIDDINGTLWEKNIVLKPMVANYLKEYCEKNKHQSPYENHVVNFWIIKQWGKINFKDEDYYKKSITKMGGLLNKYEEGGLTNEDKEITIERISSLSKVASFVNPERYFIYDSRAVFSLNWLLKKSGESERFYCQPKQKGGATRKNGSKRIACYDLLNIIRDELKEKGIDVNIPNKVTIQDYLNYCSLIRDIYLDVFTEDKVTNTMQPYKLEMLLFWIAPTKILDEVDAQYKGTIYDKSLTSNSTKEGQQSPKNKSTTKKNPKNIISENFWKKLQDKIKCSLIGKNKGYKKVDKKFSGNVKLLVQVYQKGYDKNGYQSFGIHNINENQRADLEKKVEGLIIDAKIDLGKTIIIRNMNPEYADDDKKIEWFAGNIQNIVSVIG